MLNRLLPRQFDNNYHGSKVALGLFGLLLLLKVVMGINSIFNTDSVAKFADGIPLDAFPPAAAESIVALFARVGIANLMICLLGLVVLLRYRDMVPLMFALLLLEHLARGLMLLILPVVRIGTPAGFYVNLVLLIVMLAGLVLSLFSRNAPPEQTT
jgi:hypothetical protein